MKIGVHTSIAGSIVNAVHHAKKIGCDTFQIFSANPRSWKRQELDSLQCKKFCSERSSAKISPLAIHCNYLINLASHEPVNRDKSIVAFRQEIQRAKMLKADYLIVHPGSARGGVTESAIQLCADSMKRAVGSLNLDFLTILVENTAGQGCSIGRSFEEVAEILSLANELPLGVCLDTAHCFEAGYPIHTKKGLDQTMQRAARTFGIKRLLAVHANDSKTALGSHSDRHEHIGNGQIGLAAFRRIVNHPYLINLPFICETPIDRPGDDKRNLRTLRKLSTNHGA